MSKGISEDAQVHISIAFLIKAMVGVAIVVGSWYQAQMRFASLETRMNDMHEELVVLNSKVASMENKHITELEEENRTLMQRLGIKRK
jgi:hypothetical protein|tara:strand:- start:1148 stop:1411 length:264 start_codon:yes stop_codon:yes gene_type:complete